MPLARIPWRPSSGRPMRWTCRAGSPIAAAGIGWACTPTTPTAARSWRFPATRSCGARSSTSSRSASSRTCEPVSLRDREPYPARGRPAPDFALAGLDGVPRSLSQLRGSVVLLNFWASWCEPRRRELPQLHERHSAAGLVVLGVSDEGPGQARPYLEELGIRYPSLLNAAGQAMQSYQVHALPISLIIGRDGELLKRLEGYTPAAAFERALEPLLAGTASGSGP